MNARQRLLAPVLLLAAWFAPSGCRVAAVEPRPLAGPMPEVIAVWPVAGRPAHRGNPILVGLDDAVRRRGHRVVPLRVGEQQLVDAGVFANPDPPGDEWLREHDLAVVGRTLRADALLRVVVREFDTAGELPLQSARWDLEWQLWSTRGEGLLWSFAHHGSWHQRDRDPIEPMRRFDAEPDIVPLGRPNVPDFRGADELAAWLHRLAMEHLPRGKP